MLQRHTASVQFRSGFSLQSTPDHMRGDAPVSSSHRHAEKPAKQVYKGVVLEKTAEEDEMHTHDKSTSAARLIHLLHGALTGCLSWSCCVLCGLLLTCLSLLVNIQTQRHELVDTLSEASWFVDGEARHK